VIFEPEDEFLFAPFCLILGGCRLNIEAFCPAPLDRHILDRNLDRRLEP